MLVEGNKAVERLLQATALEKQITYNACFGKVMDILLH